MPNPRLAIHFVITRDNVHTLSKMLHLGCSLEVFRIDFDHLIAYRPEQIALQLSPEQRERLPQIAREAQRVAQELGIATTLSNFTSSEGGQSQTRGSTLPSSGPEKGLAGAPCLRPWHHLVIQSDGRTSPCCVLTGAAGSVSQNSVRSVWESDPFFSHIRSRMVDHRPLSRCRECSPNILHHEMVIRDHLQSASL